LGVWECGRQYIARLAQLKDRNIAPNSYTTKRLNDKKRHLPEKIGFEGLGN